MTTTACHVAVGSTNPAKIASVVAAFNQAFPDLSVEAFGTAAPSGVPDQPRGDEETRRGARTRADNAAALFAKGHGGVAPDFAVGLEGGVGFEGDDPRLTSFAWMAVRRGAEDGSGHSCTRTATLILPPAVTKLMEEQGLELGDADDQVFGKSDSKKKEGAVGLLTRGVIDRAAFYQHALLLALVPYMNADLYFANPE